MNHKLAIQFVVFLMLALFATHRLGLLHDPVRSQKHHETTGMLHRQMDELEHLRRAEVGIYARLNQSRGSLAGASAAYLPDPADTYSWTTRQVRFLADESGVQILKIESREGPRLRAQRGQDDRQFSVQRCQVELSGNLEQFVTFVRVAEERNPLLVVSSLSVGPQDDDVGTRTGSIALDWPAWRTTALREALLAEIDDTVGSQDAASP